VLKTGCDVIYQMLSKTLLESMQDLQWNGKETDDR
jgi:hypothetical protein